MKDDWLEVELLQRPGDGLLYAFGVTMYNEDAAARDRGPAAGLRRRRGCMRRPLVDQFDEHFQSGDDGADDVPTTVSLLRLRGRAKP
jgi:hypothetical protein